MSVYIWVICPSCGKGRWKRKSHTLLPTNTNLCTVCTGKKTVRAMLGSGERGYFMQRGYRLIKLQSDDFFFPMANSKGYVRENRLVMAKHLGRCLQLWEVVHHKEGVPKSDNRIENLELHTVDGHNTITAMQNKIDALERKIKELLQRNN